MKSSCPLRFPKATKPTSLHGAPVRSNPSSAQFPEPTTGTDRTGLLRRGSRFAQFPGGRINRCTGFLAADPPRRSVSRAERQIQPHRPPVHVELASPLRLPGSAVRALRHGLLELVMPVFLRPVARSSIHQPHCAWSEHEHDVFARFPVRSRRPRGSAAHAWRHPLRIGCPREVFPRHAVTCVSSGSRCDDLTARLPVRWDVANGDRVFRVVARAIASPCA
jgi:hypothetical protein